MADLHPTNSLRDRIREVGLRATAARVAVLRTLLQASGPLSHAEVYDSVDRDGFDRATVYRNLIDLAEAGLLNRTDVGDHVWRFEAIDARSKTGDAHPHFVCNDCGTVECLPTSSVSVKRTPGTPSSLKHRSTEIHVRGVCDDCS